MQQQGVLFDAVFTCCAFIRMQNIFNNVEGEEAATGRPKPRAARERRPTRLLLAHRGFVSDERVVLKGRRE